MADRTETILNHDAVRFYLDKYAVSTIYIDFKIFPLRCGPILYYHLCCNIVPNIVPISTFEGSSIIGKQVKACFEDWLRNDSRAFEGGLVWLVRLHKRGSRRFLEREWRSLTILEISYIL